MRLHVDFNEKPIYAPEYLELQRKFAVPLHGLTAEQTRFFHYAFRNEVNVFMRTCDLTHETIISQFPPESPFIVYRNDLWWSEDFELPATAYNLDHPFFEQFRSLQLKVPRMSIACDTTQENSPYVNCSNHCKNCYMVFATGDCEDCFYCINTERSQTTMDASIVQECTRCYNIISCRTCYNLDFSVYCNDCSDSRFLYDCRRCKDCFLCVGLVGKQYCILNTQYTKKQYQAHMKTYERLTHELIEECEGKLLALRKDHPHKYAFIVGSEDCTGNDCFYSKNCKNSYIIEYSQDCMNGSSLRHCKDCVDFDLWGDPGELCYHSMSCGYGVYNLQMCFNCYNSCRDLIYCDSCPGCNDCFGCVGLKRKSYCILNVQYSQDDYEILKKRIIGDMQKSGEWGRFFPPFCSPHELNNSMAYQYFHTDQMIAKELGFLWMDKSEEKQYDAQKIYAGPFMSEDVRPEDVKGKIFLCAKTHLPFNIQTRELAILQEKKLPLPRIHWKARLEDRDGKFIFPWKIYPRETIDTHRIVSSPVPDDFPIREQEIV